MYFTLGFYSQFSKLRETWIFIFSYLYFLLVSFRVKSNNKKVLIQLNVSTQWYLSLWIYCSRLSPIIDGFNAKYNCNTNFNNYPSEKYFNNSTNVNTRDYSRRWLLDGRHWCLACNRSVWARLLNQHSIELELWIIFQVYTGHSSYFLPMFVFQHAVARNPKIPKFWKSIIKILILWIKNKLFFNKNKFPPDIVFIIWSV